MSEDDPARVELLESIDPGRRERNALIVTVPTRPPGQYVCAVGARRVVALASDHHGAVAELDYDRLMPCGVAWRRHHDHPGKDLGFAFELEVAQSGRVHQLREGVGSPPGQFQLGALDDDRT